MKILIAVGKTTRLKTVIRFGLFVQQMTAGTLSLLVVVKKEKARMKAEALLAQANQYLEAAESPITGHIRVGQLPEEIEREVIDGQYDLVVMGEPSQSLPFPRIALIGKEDIVGYLTCPVLIAQGGVRPFHRVLVCEGGLEPLLLNRLADLLPLLLAQVEEWTVLHVMSQMAAGPGVAGWELRAEADELIQKHTPEGHLLEEGIAHLEQLNIRPEIKVRHGLVVREIASEVQSGDYDLVVIGAHPSTGWQRFLLDDLAHEIIDQIDRPLLVIKR
ncbi:MAG: universal stress protein [Candidatus Promineifilaceae bacterium]